MVLDQRDRWGFDKASNCRYHVSVTHYRFHYDGESEFEVVDEVSVEVCYEFWVSSSVDAPIAEISPGNRGQWCIQDLPGRLSGLKQEILLLLERAQIPLAAREDTIALIFPGVIPPQLVYMPTVRKVVGVFLKTRTAVLDDLEPEEEMSYEDYEDIDEGLVPVIEDDEDHEEFGFELEEEEMSEDDQEEMMYEDDEDEEFGGVLEESMYEDSLRVRPARREAVEGLEKVRVWSLERETTCVVCLEEFSLGMEVSKMECSHMFHQDCLARWLKSRCFCPLCKFELPAAEEAYEDSS